MRSRTQATIEQCIQDVVVAADADYRWQRRYPYYCPVVITTGDGRGARLSAISRDISSAGIGLLHNMPLEPGRVRLSLPSMLGRQLEMDAEIRWCMPSSEGWFLSGGALMRTSVSQAASLLCAVIKSEASRRRQHRTPFFRPVSISVGAGKVGTLSAFSRDISPMGIGLLHGVPLETGQVVLSVPSAAGDRLDIRTEIQWCAPAGEGWWTSGGRFRGMLFEELPTRQL
jgi:hypothetical protein